LSKDAWHLQAAIAGAQHASGELSETGSQLGTANEYLARPGEVAGHAAGANTAANEQPGDDVGEDVSNAGIVLGMRGSAQVKEDTLRLCQQAAEDMLNKCHDVPSLPDVAHHRALLEKVSASSTTALQAFELLMRELRTSDSTNPNTAQQGWALDARKVNTELRACNAPPLHHARQRWFTKRTPVTAPKQHEALKRLCRNQVHARLEDWAPRCGTDDHLTYFQLRML
jgi:hypothetical protein